MSVLNREMSREGGDKIWRDNVLEWRINRW